MLMRKNHRKKFKHKKVKYINLKRYKRHKILNNKTLKKNNIKRKLHREFKINNFLINSFPHGICILEENKIIFLNNVALNILGIKDENKVLKKKIKDLEEYIKILYKKYREHTKSDNDSNSIVEYKILNAKNKEFYLEVVTSKIKFNGKKRTLINIRDITYGRNLEQKIIDMERERISEELKGDLLNSTCHELRTPLNLMLNAIGLIENQIKNIEDQNKFKYTNIIRKNCYRLMRFMDNIIFTFQANTDELKLNIKKVNMKKILEDISKYCRVYFELKKITFTLNINLNDDIISIDEIKMEKVILNLLSNAIKFTEEGGKVKLSAYDVNDNVYIVVEDNGSGVPKEMKEQIFQKFEQIGSLYTRENEGMGIGLYIVQKIVEAHDGQIKLKSIKNKGSKFIISIPKKIKDNIKVENTVEGLSKMERTNIEFSDINI